MPAGGLLRTGPWLWTSLLRRQSSPLKDKQCFWKAGLALPRSFFLQAFSHRASVHPIFMIHSLHSASTSWLKPNSTATGLVVDELRWRWKHTTHAKFPGIQKSCAIVSIWPGLLTPVPQGYFSFAVNLAAEFRSEVMRLRHPRMRHNCNGFQPYRTDIFAPLPFLNRRQNPRQKCLHTAPAHIRLPLV